jgi:putative FmdB family regulatory protein
MPTYEYRCKDCGHELEVVQSFTDEPLTECLVCGGTLRKVFGNVGISFKGSGFYKTDSRAGAGSKKGSSSSSESSESSSSSSSSEASKPETSKPSTSTTSSAESAA